MGAKPGGRHPLPRLGFGGNAAGGAEASSTGRRSAGVNLRRPLRVGTWNVLSLADDDHIPVLSKELSRLGIAVVGLTEVRRPGSGMTVVGGYTYYWSGRSDGRHTEGVAVAVANWLAPMIMQVTPVNERLLRLRIKHSLGVFSLVIVYAPTEMANHDAKETFYAKLQSEVERCPRRDTLLVVGDFNATTGTDRTGYEECIGPHGSGIRGTNGAMLLDFARNWGLRIAGSWYQRSLLHRWSWYSNTGSVAKEIDHILVDGRWRLLQNCRVFRSAQIAINTDHRLVVADLKIRLKSKRLPRSSPRLDVDGLKDREVSEAFARRLEELSGDLSASEGTEELWQSFKTNVLEAAGECLGQKRPSKGGFLTGTTLDLLDRSRCARLNGNTELYRQLRRQAVQALKADKENHVLGICEQVENHLWSSDSKPAYRGISALRGSKPPPGCSTVKAVDGSVLTDGSEVLARWAGYFEELYQADPPAGELNIEGISPPVPDPPISCDPPSLEETRGAVKQLKGGKAPGVCGIHAEFLKAGGLAVLLQLHAVLCSVWRTGVIPADWRRGLVVPLWKGKGDRLECSNYRAVTLLSVPGKVFARVLLGRIRYHLLAYQRPEQSGFTPKRSTIDRILALRILIERKREYQQRFLAVFVDLRKAFDSIDRESLWIILGLRGIPPGLVRLISALYTDTSSVVRCGSGISDSFPVNSGVRQGCILAPTLFNTCMDWVLGRVAADADCGTSLGGARITDLDFADDAVIFAETLDALAGTLRELDKDAGTLGLQVSWIKTKIQAFGDLLDEAVQTVTIDDGIDVDIVDRFTYLGSDIHVSMGSEPEVIRRLGRACGAMNSLDKGVWRSRYLCKRTKLRVFKALVLPVLLYGCETWTLTRSLRSRLNAFGTRSLRRILGYRWNDFVSNQRLLEETRMRWITCIIRERQLRLFGHVARFPESNPAYRILFEDHPEGWRRPRGRPKSSWLQQMDQHLRGMGLDQLSARTVAKDDPNAFRRMVDAATRCLGACPHT